MSKEKKPTDECISNDAIQRIHNAMAKGGIKESLNDLLARESVLGAYVLFSGHTVSETVRISGAPPSLVNWVKDSVMAHALVCIAAQEKSHYTLWREFMGDFDEPKGEHHGG